MWWGKPKLKVGQAFYTESKLIDRIFHLVFVHRLYKTAVLNEKYVEMVNEKGEIVYNWPVYKFEGERAPKYDIHPAKKTTYR